MSACEYLGLALVAAPAVVYLSVRLGSAAYFKSKREFDQSQPRKGN